MADETPDPRLEPLQTHLANKKRDIDERKTRLHTASKAERPDAEKIIKRKERDVEQLLKQIDAIKKQAPTAKEVK